MAKISHCPVCNSIKQKEFWALRGYKLARCSECSMVWDPFPQDNLLSQYSENYFINNNPKGGYANYFEGMRINSKTFAMRLKRLKKQLKNTGNLLDLGCALGDCLIEAKKLGWIDPVGLDTSSFACNQCKKRGLKAICGTLNTVKLPENSFDLITSQDVIEHVTDPVSELKRIIKIMKPGATLFIVTPEMDGWWLRLLHGWWYHYKPGEHVIYFSQSTIKKALTRAGYVDIATSATPHIMSVEYILKRLCYYSPLFFGFFLKIAQLSSLDKLSLRVYTGELEAIAKKPIYKKSKNKVI